MAISELNPADEHSLWDLLSTVAIQVEDMPPAHAPEYPTLKGFIII